MTDLVDDHPGGLPPATGVALIGYRATGKTTVGRLLAARLGRELVDTDEWITRQAGISIPAIFDDGGEERFRCLEEAAISHLTLGHRGAILATGGGAVLREPNRRALRNFGVVVWLAAPVGVLVSRLRADDASHLRPALTEAGLLDEVATVLEAREPLYRDCADVVVDASTDGPQVVVEQIVRLLSMTRRGDRR